MAWEGILASQAGLTHPSPPSSGPFSLQLCPPGARTPEAGEAVSHRWPIEPVPAERHPRLSLEVLRAEKSICPGTQAWSRPSKITVGSMWLSSACSGASGLVQGPEGLAEPPYRLLHPQMSWSALTQRLARPHQKLQANIGPWKVLARRKQIANRSVSWLPSWQIPQVVI